MKKTMSIILLCNAFLNAMDNKQAFIEKLESARKNPQHELARVIIYNRTEKGKFVNKGTICTLHPNYWPHIAAGNFVYAPFFTLSDEANNDLIAKDAVIVGTTDEQDAKTLKDIFKGYTRSIIKTAKPDAIYKTIEYLAEQKSKL